MKVVNSKLFLGALCTVALLSSPLALAKGKVKTTKPKAAAVAAASADPTEDEDYDYIVVLSPDTVLQYASQVNFADPILVASIAQVESDYQPFATNHYKGVTYYGLMQISYGTAKMVGYKGTSKDLLDWKINLTYAMKYLDLLLQEHHDLKEAIASYNAGSPFFCKKKCKKGNFVNQGYVNKVMKNYASLNAKKPTG